MSDPNQRYAHDERDDADHPETLDEIPTYEPADELERALQATVVALDEHSGEDEDFEDRPSWQRPAHAALAMAAAAAPPDEAGEDDGEPFYWRPPGNAPRSDEPAAGADGAPSATGPWPRPAGTGSEAGGDGPGHVFGQGSQHIDEPHPQADGGPREDARAADRGRHPPPFTADAGTMAQRGQAPPAGSGALSGESIPPRYDARPPEVPAASPGDILAPSEWAASGAVEADLARAGQSAPDAEADPDTPDAFTQALLAELDGPAAVGEMVRVAEGAVAKRGFGADFALPSPPLPAADGPDAAIPQAGPVAAAPAAATPPPTPGPKARPETAATGHPWLRRRATEPDSAAEAAAEPEWELDAAIGEIVANRGTGADESNQPSAPSPARRARGFEDQVTTSFFRRRPNSGALLRTPARSEETATGGASQDAAGADDAGTGGDAAPRKVKPGPSPTRLPGQFGRAHPVPEFRFAKPAEAPAGEAGAPHPSRQDDPLAPALFGAPLDWSGARRDRNRAGLASGSLADVSAMSVERALAGAGLAGDDPAAQPQDDLSLEAEIAALARGVADTTSGEDAVGEDGRLPASLGAHADAVGPAAGHRRRSFAVAGGVLVLLLAGAAGLVGYKTIGGTGEVGGEPPIIRADADDVKVFPSEDPDAEPDVAFEGLVGENEPGDARLVVPETPEIREEQPAIEEGDDVLRSRLVRTVVVRPDGTIVREPTAEASAADEVTGQNTVSSGGEASQSGPFAAAGGSSSQTDVDAESADGSAAAESSGWDSDSIGRLVDSASRTGDEALGTEPAEQAAAIGETAAPDSAGGSPDDAQTALANGAQSDTDPFAAESAATAANASLNDADQTVAAPAVPRRRPAPPPRRAATTTTASAAALPENPEPQVASQSVAPGFGEAAVASNGQPEEASGASGVDAVLPPEATPEAQPSAATSPRRGAFEPETGLVRPANNAFIDRALGLKSAPEPPQRRLANVGPVSPNASRTTAQLLPWSVQIASQRSAREAQQSYEAMQERFPSIIGNRPPVIRKVDIAGRGTFYRVRIPAGSREEARNICAQLKAAGGECFVGPSDSS